MIVHEAAPLRLPDTSSFDTGPKTRNFPKPPSFSRQASAWKPDLPGLDRNWGFASFRAELYSEAVPPLERQLKAHRDDSFTRPLLGLSYSMLENDVKVVDVLHPFLEHPPDDPGLLELGRALLQQEDATGAMESLGKGHKTCSRSRPESEAATKKYAEESMKQSLLTVGVATTLMIAWSIGRVQGQQDQSKGKVIFASADQANFHDTGNGVAMAGIWGDADQGAHATFTKFVPGFDAGTHTHTNDVWIVVVKGAYLHKDETGDKRMGPGGFLRVPGGWKHWSGGDPKEGTLFYEESSGKFDTIPAK